MILLLISFVAGVLTILSPCVLPLLPVIVGGAATDLRSRWKPYIITLSLSCSVVVFTLLLKFATLFINVPSYVWQWISGLILITFGFSMLLPRLWERVSSKGNLLLMRKSNALLAEGVKKESIWGDVLIGAALGPVFSSCSPTYFVILATVLPGSFVMGLVDLIAYAIGLSLVLLCVALIGQRLVGKLSGASDPEGWFKRTLGAIFVIVGVFVALGWSRAIETYLINNFALDITKVETSLLQAIEGENGDMATTTKSAVYPKYQEIVSPAGFVNSEPFELADLVGERVILLDIMTYSCINCQRTYPYLRAWHEKYKDQGLSIVAIHTPEFAFEKKRENVEAAMKQFGLSFPVVLDNDYGTWNAYGNNYWPRKYLIDIDGYIRYDHIGEGTYEETESMIKELLKERAERLEENVDVSETVVDDIAVKDVEARSVETYFGAFRNRGFLGNGDVSRKYEGSFIIPESLSVNKFYLGGKWRIENEYIESIEESIVVFSYDAREVYLVAESISGSRIQVKNEIKGQEGMVNVSNIDISGSTLYTIISNKERKTGVIRIKADPGVRMYALTFG